MDDEFRFANEAFEGPAPPPGDPVSYPNDDLIELASLVEWLARAKFNAPAEAAFLRKDQSGDVDAFSRLERYFVLASRQVHAAIVDRDMAVIYVTPSASAETGQFRLPLHVYARDHDALLDRICNAQQDGAALCILASEARKVWPMLKIPSHESGFVLEGAEPSPTPANKPVEKVGPNGLPVLPKDREPEMIERLKTLGKLNNSEAIEAVGRQGFYVQRKRVRLWPFERRGQGEKRASKSAEKK